MTAPQPVTALRGVGEALAERLRVLGVETTQDLLFLLPSRYEDRTRTVPLGELQLGQRAAVEGEVLLTETLFRGRRQLLCRIGDGSGFLTLRFFHFSSQQQNGLARGVRIRCFGEIRRSPQGLEIVHPEYRRVDSDAANAEEDHLTPIYPATEGITQGRLRMLVRLALEGSSIRDLEDWVPPSVLTDSQLPSLRDSLNYVHRPPPDAPVDLLMERRHPSQRRLAFEELLAHQLSLKQLRARIQRSPGWPLHADGTLKTKLMASLPFALHRCTGARTRRNRKRSRPSQADATVGSGRRRLWQDARGCASRGARRPTEPPSRTDGPHGIIG